MTINQFVEKWKGKKADLTLGFMDFNMLRASDYFKVFNSVVRVISVYVVDYFARFKFSANGFFNYFSITFTFPVGVVSDVAFNKIPLAFFRAKNMIRSSLSTFVVFKNVSTLFAFKPAFPRFIITISRAKPGTLTGWSLKFFFTKFTKVFHNVIITHNAWSLI